MNNLKDIHEHMKVVGSDGKHVGTVDHLEGSDKIKLTKTDPAAKGQHHFIPAAWIDRIDTEVHLKKSGAEAMKQWQAAA